MKIADYLNNTEQAELMRRSDMRGFWAFAVNWGLIVAAFAMAILWPNPVTIILAILILAGRQLGLGILVHDCSHNALFESRRLNEIMGRWFAGAPINLALPDYRTYHLTHHRYAGTPNDPDLSFVAQYPVSRASLKRKFVRDVTGQTGLRDFRLAMAQFRLAKQWPWLLFHALLLTAVTLAGAMWAYALWWAAQFFAYPVIARLRQIGEHGVVPDRGSIDPRMNTSTTLARWWERLFIAPNHVHYHLEHHVAAGIAPYRLKAMHGLLAERGFYDGFDCLSHGYADVIKRAVRAD